jgi:hypothetical protein
MRFNLGCIVATPGALRAMEKSGDTPDTFLSRHASGDWGELCDEDKSANEVAIQDNERIMSVYSLADGEKIWVITESDRSVTTVLLPDEY